MQSVAQWLQTLGLPQYAELFDSQGLDFETLPLICDQDLEKLGIVLGHRRKLLKAIEQLGDVPVAAVTKQESEPAPPVGTTDVGERRQLTVLFCDMVGFTELASRIDPEILQRIVNAYEDACAVCITRFDGYVFQRLGDGIVAFFGYPLAHEGEAERAVRAGLAIVDALANLDVPEVGRIAVRIGIATGLVVVTSAEKGAVGETMNLASRLQNIARPGSIVVSEPVRRLAGGAFEYEDLGEHSLKGIAQPARAYRIAGVSQAATRFDAASGARSTPLVGREHELSMLLGRWELSKDGEGQVVLLSGEPGIGKSRLLNTLQERIEAQGGQALRYQCSPYYANSALWPSIDNLERVLRFARDESYASRLDKLEALVVGRYGRPVADVRFLAAMLSIPCDERYGAITMTPQKFKDETLRTLADLIEAAARQRPTLMLFEDLHWADPTTLEALDLLIDRCRTFPLLMLLTHRPEFQPRWSAHGHVAALNLSKLTRAQSGAMLTRLAGKPLPDELIEQILAKTDGVPLFVEELTKSILESGQLKDAGDRYEYAGSAQSIAIPATLRDSLMARLDRYQPVKEIAQIGAAIGREFSHELVSAVAPLPASQLDAALAQLTDSGLAFRRGTPPDAIYVFKHALIQDAAYDSLLKSRRQELHARIARVLERQFPAVAANEPEVLAYHYTHGGQIDQALPLWRRAGEAALSHMALSESISHLSRGLELAASLPASPQRDESELSLRIPLGTAWMALKGWAAEEIWTTFHPARTLGRKLGRHEALSPSLWGLSRFVLCTGRAAESMPWIDEMLDTARAAGDSDLLVVGHMAACISEFYLGHLHRTLHHCEQIDALYDTQRHCHLAAGLMHDPKTIGSVFNALATWILGYPDRAVERCRAGDAHARELGHPFDMAFGLSVGGELFDLRGEPDTLRSRALECGNLGREHRLPFLYTFLEPTRTGIALIHTGQAAGGIPMLRAGTDLWNSVGGQIHGPYLKAVLAEGLLAVDDLDAAAALIDGQIEQVERPGWQERLHYAEILRLRGAILTRKGDLDGAQRCHLASLEWARQQQAKSWELRTAISLARLWQAQGRQAQARELLAPVYGWFTEGFDTKDLREAKALLAQLQG
jgi:class 3 adenylate cyclase